MSKFEEVVEDSPFSGGRHPSTDHRFAVPFDSFEVANEYAADTASRSGLRLLVRKVAPEIWAVMEAPVRVNLGAGKHEG